MGTHYCSLHIFTVNLPKHSHQVAMAQTSFKGYAIHDTKKWTDFQVVDFQPKRMEDYDVEIKITYCGVCGSDVHTITGGWSEDIITPMITGHEIVGKVTAVGPKVKEFKVGDRAGVGAQAWSCMDCNRCKSDNENYCKSQVDTYNAKYPHTGDIAHGGYSTGCRVHEQFVFPIPDNLEDKYAAPMLCGGLTVYSPLVRHGAKMGAKNFVNTSDEDWVKQAGEDFDLIVSTRDVAEGFPIDDFLSILNVHGKFVTCGLPDNPLPQIPAFAFASNGAFFGGTHIGNKKECVEMLKLAASKGIKTWVEELSMKDASKAVQGVKDNKVRYRYVLKQDIDP